MEKGYYKLCLLSSISNHLVSQSTIKMEKGYYLKMPQNCDLEINAVAIHNKNGKGLLLFRSRKLPFR